MREQLSEDVALDRVLRDLAARIVYPPTPNLSASVRAAVVEADGRRARPRFGWRPIGRSLPAAVVALLLLVGTALAVGIGLRGLSIVFVESPRHLIGQGFELGEPVTLADAQQRVSYPILLPAGDLGRPDEVYLDLRAGLEQVTLVYRSGAVSPAGEDDEVGLLITQFRARPDSATITKEVGPATTVEPVVVGGEPGFWIEGSPHVLLYRDPSGATISDRVRLVGDVLVWQRADLTLRLEGVGTQEQAVTIAESMD